MRRLLINSIVCLLVLMTMFGCGDRQKMIYHDYQSTAADGWKKKDTLKMEILPSDSACVVSLFAEVRNGLNYPYSNLYLVVKQNLTDSIHWQTDTIHFTLADSLGRWTGIGGGHFYQSSAYVRTLRLPPHPKHTVIRVSHGMKDDVLKGISDVGFRLVVR